MLTLTEKALELIGRIPDNPMLPPEAGLRISRRGTAGPMTVEASGAPHGGDKILDYEGGRVFLGQQAAGALKGKLLDARLDAAGRIEFLVTKPA